jgi:hypothetical protein
LNLLPVSGAKGRPRASCSASQTPASCQSRSLRQQVIPDPNPQLLGQELPRNARVEHEQDPAQRRPVIQPLTTRMPEPPLNLGQQRLDPFPQAFLYLPRLRPRHTNPPKPMIRRAIKIKAHSRSFC